MKTITPRENVKQYNICLPPQLVERLDAAAERHYTSRSTLLRQAAAELLQRLGGGENDGTEPDNDQ